MTDDEIQQLLDEMHQLLVEQRPRLGYISPEEKADQALRRKARKLGLPEDAEPDEIFAAWANRCWEVRAQKLGLPADADPATIKAAEREVARRRRMEELEHQTGHCSGSENERIG